MKKSLLVITNIGDMYVLILTVVLLEDINIVSVDGHLFKILPAKQTNPDGKCAIANNKSPGTQVGNMLLHPCGKKKLSILCPSFLQGRNSSRCNLEKRKGTGNPPFNFTATDLYDEILAREMRGYSRWNQYISDERYGRFFDRIDDGHAVYKKGDKQCHEDTCCSFKDVPDVATRCQRPWMGPYELVGGLYIGQVDQFSWLIPEGYYGDVVFVGTFITSVNQFWPDVRSNIIYIEKSERINPRQRYDEDFSYMMM